MTGIPKKKCIGLFTTGRGIVRLIRFAIGSAGLAYGIINHDIFSGLFGGLLILMAVFNFGCPMGSCSVPPPNNTKR